MDSRKDVENRIRESWFKEHQATYTDYGELKVLQWRQPGSIYYHIRYVFDGNNLYISGDTGEAVFCFTEKVDVHRLARYDLGYFEGKLKAYHESRRDFNSQKAVERLRVWLKDLKEAGKKYDHDEMKVLFKELREECSSSKNWAFIVNNHADFISDLDVDYFEWIYGIGDEIPWRVHGYLIGLKMAAEQLPNGASANMG